MSDSAQARFTTFEVPGLMMTPIPHGIVTSDDRSQLNDIYAGIGAVLSTIRSVTCWTPSKGKATLWIGSKKNTSIWVPEKDKHSSWADEREVVPCQD